MNTQHGNMKMSMSPHYVACKYPLYLFLGQISQSSDCFPVTQMHISSLLFKHMALLAVIFHRGVVDSRMRWSVQLLTPQGLLWCLSAVE